MMYIIFSHNRELSVVVARGLDCLNVIELYDLIVPVHVQVSRLKLDEILMDY
jgi:hypothetical protein